MRRPGIRSTLLQLTALLWALNPFLARTNGQEPVLRVITMPTIEETSPAGLPRGLEVNDDLQFAWQRLRDRALSEKAKIIVFEVTTPGGSLGTTDWFLADLENLRREHGVRTIAYVPRAATSAGAIIALACGELLLAPSATIGNAIPYAVLSGGRVASVDAKQKTMLITMLSRIAVQGGFNELLLHGMIDHESELLLVNDPRGTPEIFRREDFDRRFPGSIAAERNISVHTIKPSGQALELLVGANTVGLPGFPFKEVRDRDEIRQAIGLSPRPLQPEEILKIQAPSSGFFKQIFQGTNWSSLLLVAGIIFFIIEMKTPGLGLFGILAVLSLVGYFILNSSDGAPLAVTVSLLLLGFFLLLVELLIVPGMAIPGILGGLLILGSIYSGTVDFGGSTLSERLIPDSEADWQKVEVWAARLMGAIVLGVAGALFLARHLHRLPILQGAFLKVPTLRPAEARATAAAAPGAAAAVGFVNVLPGVVGEAETDLRPSGKMRFSQGIVDVVSQGDWIEKGTMIQVIQVEGNRVVVSPARSHT